MKKLTHGQAPNYMKVIFAVIICAPALFMPHFFRVKYTRLVSDIFHLPLIIFGKVSTYLLKKLDISSDDLRKHFGG
jgi:hypothetical protein